MKFDYTFPFANVCDLCKQEWLHHHTGSKTVGMPHEGGGYYCWCLDEQAPSEDAPNVEEDAA